MRPVVSFVCHFRWRPVYVRIPVIKFIINVASVFVTYDFEVCVHTAPNPNFPVSGKAKNTFTCDVPLCVLSAFASLHSCLTFFRGVKMFFKHVKICLPCSLNNSEVFKWLHRNERSRPCVRPEIGPKTSTVFQIKRSGWNFYFTKLLHSVSVTLFPKPSI